VVASGGGREDLEHGIVEVVQSGEWAGQQVEPDMVGP